MQPARNVRRTRRPRSLRTRLVGLLGAAALVVVGCETDDTPDDQAAEPPADEPADPDAEADPDAPVDPEEELDPEEMEELEDLLGEQEDMDLPDPNEHLDGDGVFRGVGVMMPVPEGWQLDEMSFAQGMVVAITEAGEQTLAAQAVDTGDVEEELDYDQLVESSRDDLGGEADADEEIELAGAERAHLLRFDDLPAQQEDGPTNSLLTLIADDGNGELAMFNYVAPTDDYDADTEQLLLAESGFDPDSDPQPPVPAG